MAGENELVGGGLSWCATGKDALHRGDDLVVTGAGDSAMEDALFRATDAGSVAILQRRNELRASDIMARRARGHDMIDIRWNIDVTKIHGSPEAGVEGVRTITDPDGYPTEQRSKGIDIGKAGLWIGGVFYAIGHSPDTEFLQDTPLTFDGDG